MRHFSILLGVLVLGLLAGGWLAGQDKKDADVKKDGEVKKDADVKKDSQPKLKGVLPPNWKKLGLSEDQVQKIYKVQADYDTKVNDLQEKIKKLKVDEKADLMKVLTEAQKARLKEINEEKSGETTPPKDK